MPATTLQYRLVCQTRIPRSSTKAIRMKNIRKSLLRHHTSTTASITYNRPLADGNWATTVLWGRNREAHAHINGYLVESTLNFKRRNYLYTRWELIDKLGLLGDRSAARQDAGAGPSWRVGAYTFGAVRDIPLIPGIATGIGGDVTFYSKPAALDTIYGKSPVSFHVFLRLRPGAK